MPTPHQPPPTDVSRPDSYIQVVLTLKGLAADFANVFPFLAVREVVLAERAGAAEHLPAEAAIQKWVLRGSVLPLSFPCTSRGGPASFVSLVRHLQSTWAQV